MSRGVRTLFWIFHPHKTHPSFGRRGSVDHQSWPDWCSCAEYELNLDPHPPRPPRRVGPLGRRDDACNCCRCPSTTAPKCVLVAPSSPFPQNKSPSRMQEKSKLLRVPRCACVLHIEGALLPLARLGATRLFELQRTLRHWWSVRHPAKCGVSCNKNRWAMTRQM